MTLEELSYVSQIVGVVAIFASLIFVGLQIRQNTKALKATSHHAITDSFNAINNLILSDPRVARTWRLALAGSEELDEDERTSANFNDAGQHAHLRDALLPIQQRHLGQEAVDAELKTLKWVVTGPGFLTWWAANPISLSAEFRAFIDGLIREAAPQPGPRP